MESGMSQQAFHHLGGDSLEYGFTDRDMFPQEQCAYTNLDVNCALNINYFNQQSNANIHHYEQEQQNNVTNAQFSQGGNISVSNEIFTENCAENQQFQSSTCSKEKSWNNGCNEETKDEMDGESGVSPGDSCTQTDPVLKQSQIATTLQWLTENYERADGVCLPRCVLYTHYLDLCKKSKFTPAGAATFGKIIRQRFPKLTTRRLGTRGQSKYHYYGIGIKETSIYYQSVYTGKGLTRFSGTKVKTEGSSRKHSLGAKTGTLLPEFPDATLLELPSGVQREKVETFIMMYRTHCQRILDTVIGANFDEVQNFLLHFWQGMPAHLMALLSEDFLCDVIGLCDCILYRVLVDVLIPSTIQDLPDCLSAEIRSFVNKLPAWTSTALEEVSPYILKKKRAVLRMFTSSMKRQLSFIHLAQTSRTVLGCTDSVTQMVGDLSSVDLSRVCHQAGFTDPTLSMETWSTVAEQFTELKSLLKKQSSVEALTEWIDNIIDSSVLQVSKDSIQTKGAEFLLQWTVFGSLIMRDLTLTSAPSFGALHLLHILLDEYVFLVLETQANLVKERDLKQAVNKLHKKSDENFKINLRDKPSISSNSTTASTKTKKHKTESLQKACEEMKNNNGEATHSSGPETNNSTDRRVNQVTASNPCIAPPPHHVTTSRSYRTDNPQTYIPPVPHIPPEISPMKHHVGSMDTSNLERTYLSHIGFRNTYPEYVNQPNIIHPTHVQNFTDPTGHIIGASALNCPGFSMPIPEMPPYWNDARGHVTFQETYHPYACYNKYVAGDGYDSYSRSAALLRRGWHPDRIGRSAFQTTRPYYTRNHDAVTGALTNLTDVHVMHQQTTYNQYGHPEAMTPQQKDVYSGKYSTSYSHPIIKPLLSPYR